MGVGYMLPGVPSIPNLLKDDQEGYNAALRAVDASVLAGEEQLSPIVGLTVRVFLLQMANGVREYPEAAPQFVALLKNTAEKLQRMLAASASLKS